MRTSRVGIDGRLVGSLVGVTVLAVGLGFGLAAGLDGPGRRVAVAVPAAPVSPEAIDPAPPPVTVSTPLPAATIAPPASTVTQPQTQPQPEPEIESPPPPDAPQTAPPVTPRPSRPTPTTPVPTPPARVPAGPAQPVRPPAPDPGESVPFRPEAASTPLAQFVVADDELAADGEAATAALRSASARAPVAGTTRADIGHVLELGRRFADARLTGRKATIARIVRLNAWWYSRRRAPAARVLVRDPEGLIYSYAPGRGFALNPVGTAGRWQGLNEGFTALRLATTFLELGVSEIRGGRQTLNFEYYDVADQPTAIRPGVSAMAQARLARLMAGAYQSTGDLRFATASVDAMASLSVPVATGGSRSMVAFPAGSASAPWFVERAYPGDDPWKGAALNGLMVTLVELRSAERTLREPSVGPSVIGDAAANEARRLADEGAATLDRFLPAHDSGEWSYYGLSTPGRPFRTYLANATYHCYHITLLRTLASQYPSFRFGTFADTWSGYATRAGTRCPGANATPTG